MKDKVTFNLNLYYYNSYIQSPDKIKLLNCKVK
jgi:hypothetical protein